MEPRETVSHLCAYKENRIINRRAEERETHTHIYTHTKREETERDGDKLGTAARAAEVPPGSTSLLHYYTVDLQIVEAFKCLPPLRD